MHSKQWHYSLHRDFQNCYSTRRSPTGFFSSNSTRVPIHPHTTYTCTVHPENSPSRIQFYMQKTKSSSSTTTTYRGQRDLHSSLQKRNSTHRRQGDLLEMHPCVTRTFQAFQPQDLPKALQSLQTFQSFRHSRHSSLSRHSRHSSLSRHSSHSRHSRDIPDIPVIHDLPAFPGNSTNSTNSGISRESTPVQHSPIRMHILQFDWFPQKLH